MRAPAYLLFAIAIFAVPGQARAAGSAYQVDTSEVASSGCKIEIVAVCGRQPRRHCLHQSCVCI